MRFNKLALICGCAGILAGIALSGCNSSSTDDDIRAARIQSINNLKQLGVALHNYHSAIGAFPSAGPSEVAKPARFGNSPFCWRVALLPFIEQQGLHNWINYPTGILSDAVLKAEIPQFQHPIPSKRKGTESYYRVFTGNGAAFEFGREVGFDEFADGVANTLLVVESAEPIAWHSLDDFKYDPNAPLPKLGLFPGGFYALMGDGRIVWIPESTDDKTIRGLITRNGGEQVESPKSATGRE